MGDTSRKRPWLAALLSLLVPGLGHAYLREWLRTVLWLGLAFSVTWLLLPPSAMEREPTVRAMLEISRQLPLRTQLAVLAVTALSMIDAYWLASNTGDAGRSAEAGAGATPTPTEGTTAGAAPAQGTGGAADETTSCPNCGKELDADLDFCHWCTTELDRSG